MSTKRLIKFIFICGVLITLAFSAEAQIIDKEAGCVVQLNEEYVNKKDVPHLARLFAEYASVEITRTYSITIRGFSVDIPCSQVENIIGKNHPLVKSLTDDVTIYGFRASKIKPSRKLMDTQVVSYGVTRVGGSHDGTGKTAWIIDTGIDLTHPDLNVDKTRGMDVFWGNNNPNSMFDKNGHGTHVAGIIGAKDNNIGTLGVAAGSTVVPIRVLDENGAGVISGILAGIEHVAGLAQEGDCVNLSLGSEAFPLLDEAVLNASKKTLAYFTVAAGNSGMNAKFFSPARVNGKFVNTISAIDQNDIMPNWSNYGKDVDYSAPGLNIISLSLNGTTAILSGTSMATPHACAVLMMTNGSPSINGTAHGDPDGIPDPIIHF